MRLVLLFLFFSIFPQSNAGLFDNISGFFKQAADTMTNFGGNTVNNIENSMSDLLKNPQKIVDELKSKVDKAAIFKDIVQKIQQVISIDKILSSLKDKINSQQIISKIKNSMNLQQIFKEIVKIIKQKVNIRQLFNKLFSPLQKYTQQFFNNRSKFCDAVCEKWYNLPCFLVMNCEQKINDFKQIIILPAIILSAVCICCCGAYIFFVLSNCVKFIKCLFLPVKVIFQNLKMRYRYKNHHRLQSQQDQQDQQINQDSPPCPINSEIVLEIAIEEKMLNKNSEHVEHEDYEIQPSLDAQRLNK